MKSTGPSPFTEECNILVMEVAYFNCSAIVTSISTIMKSKGPSLFTEDC